MRSRYFVDGTPTAGDIHTGTIIRTISTGADNSRAQSPKGIVPNVLTAST